MSDLCKSTERLINAICGRQHLPVDAALRMLHAQQTRDVETMVFSPWGAIIIFQDLYST